MVSSGAPEARYQGPQAIERNYALEEVPVFLKAGAIIPMQPQMKFSNEKPVDPLILTISPAGRLPCGCMKMPATHWAIKYHEGRLDAR